MTIPENFVVVPRTVVQALVRMIYHEFSAKGGKIVIYQIPEEHQNIGELKQNGERTVIWIEGVENIYFNPRFLPPDVADMDKEKVKAP